MRVTTVFNRLLGFPGTVVESVSWAKSEIVISVRMRSKMLVCPCGHIGHAAYDRHRRGWRHLDLGGWTVRIEAEVRRVDCRGCRQVRTEWTSWARPGSRHTQDFEDMAVWLAQRMAKSSVATMLRTSWQTVDGIVTRQVDAHLDESRLDSLHRIGVDEIAYKKGRKFLTVVADHDTSTVVWIGEGRSQAVLNEFFDLLGERRRQQIEAVSMDMTRIYREATITALPQAKICFDPFHVIMWAGDAIDQAHLATPRSELHVDGLSPAKTWRKVRTTLRSAAETLDPTGKAILRQLQQHQPRLHHAWKLKEQLRRLYRDIKPSRARKHLQRWCHDATASGINAMVTLSRRIHRNLDGIINAVHTGLSNSLVEGVNAGIRLIQRRAHGYANLTALTTMIYLCHGGVPTRPHRTPTTLNNAATVSA